MLLSNKKKDFSCILYMKKKKTTTTTKITTLSHLSVICNPGKKRVLVLILSRLFYIISVALKADILKKRIRL